jgi:hypothetical protein
VQSVAQQTPCAQTPEAHEEGSVQVVPLAAPAGALSASAGGDVCPAAEIAARAGRGEAMKDLSGLRELSRLARE